MTKLQKTKFDSKPPPQNNSSNDLIFFDSCTTLYAYTISISAINNYSKKVLTSAQSSLNLYLIHLLIHHKVRPPPCHGEVDLSQSRTCPGEDR